MQGGWIAALTVLAVGVVCAQDTTRLEVRGVVSDLGTGSGLVGAQVTVYQFSIDSEKSVLAKGVTDSQGRFEFYPDRPGRYFVEASKAEYFADAAPPAQVVLKALSAGRQAEGVSVTGSLVELNKEHPREFVRLGLMRPSELTGRVLDDKDKPVGSSMVYALELGLPGVELASPPAGRARTAADGSFVISGLPPGQYFVRVSPQSPLVSKPPVTKFSEEDQNAVDEDLATAFWPGSRDMAGAGVITLASGTPLDLGAIHVGRTQLYRMRVSIRGCEPGEGVRYSLAGPGSSETIGFQPSLPPVPLPGCDDFLIRGLPPGAWEIALQTKQRWALVPFEIVNRNASLSIALVPDGQAAGEIVAAHDGMSLDIPKATVALTSADPLVFTDRFMVSSPVTKGKFSLRAIRGQRHTVSMNGLGKQYYVKEIRVDGVALSESTVTLGLASQVEIVIDDQPAALTGLVTVGDEKIAQPRIYVERWPPPASPRFNAPVGPSSIAGDADGGFQIAGLRPGQYRVLALPSGPIPDGAAEWKLTPQMWERAETVTLERGKTNDVRLKMIDPMR